MLAASVLGLMVGMAGRVEADVTLTLDDTAPTFAIPTQGTLTYTINGTVTVSSPDTGAGVVLSSIPFALPPSSGRLSIAIDPNVPKTISDTYSGPLLDVTVLVTSPPATYVGGQVLAIGSNGSFSQDAVIFSVALVQQAVAVPEPSTALVGAFGAAAFLAYGWSRHRREQRRQPAA
jgi:hypothetical protein